MDIVKDFSLLSSQARDYYNEWGRRVGEKAVELCASAAGADVRLGWDRGLIHAGEVMYAYEIKDHHPVKLTKFRGVVRRLLAEGVYPSTTELVKHGYAYEGTPGFGGAYLKSGSYTYARRQELLAAGYSYDWEKRRYSKD